MIRRETIVWHKDHPEQFCGEPIFIKTPGSVEEDDGLLLVPIMTVRDGDSPFVLILSAKNLSEIARIEIPRMLPPGFHSHYVEKRIL